MNSNLKGCYELELNSNDRKQIYILFTPSPDDTVLTFVRSLENLKRILISHKVVSIVHTVCQGCGVGGKISSSEFPNFLILTFLNFPSPTPNIKGMKFGC